MTERERQLERFADLSRVALLERQVQICSHRLARAVEHDDRDGIHEWAELLDIFSSELSDAKRELRRKQ